MIGCMAYSKAGHDRKKIYLIIREEDEYVYVLDGKTRTFDNPKKKNKKHIQVIKRHKNPVLEKKLLNNEAIDCAEVIQEVKACQKQM